MFVPQMAGAESQLPQMVCATISTCLLLMGVLLRPAYRSFAARTLLLSMPLLLVSAASAVVAFYAAGIVLRVLCSFDAACTLLASLLLALPLTSIHPYQAFHTTVTTTAASPVQRKGQHVKDKSSWTSSIASSVLRRQQSQSIIDFSGYDSAVTSPTPLYNQHASTSGTCHAITEPFWVQALYDFESTNRNEMSFRKGVRLLVVDYRGNWWRAARKTPGNASNAGHAADYGFIPSNFIQVIRKARVTPLAAATSNRRRHASLVDPTCSAAKKDSSFGWQLDDKYTLPVQPGQIVEVLECPSPDDAGDDTDAGQRRRASWLRGDEESMWIVRGVDARIGPVPADWLELLTTNPSTAPIPNAPVADTRAAAAPAADVHHPRRDELFGDAAE